MDESSDKREEAESEDLVANRNKAKKTPTGRLEIDLAELWNEIQFMVAQIDAEFESYSPADLERAKEKISTLRRKAEAAKDELAKRENGS
jgi:hypothetical protein